MFYEYAVDPECYAHADQIKDLGGNFGWGEGRLISNFPKTWLRKVKEAQDTIFNQLTFREKQILTEEWNWLRDKKSKYLINSGRDYDGNNPDWIWNTLNQHKIKPFQAIVAHKRISSNQDILLPNELTGREPRWKIRHDDRVPRSPEALCNCVRLLFQESATIRLIDPYFDPTKRQWLSTLSAFINLSHTSEIEYHIKIENRIMNDIDKDKIKNGNYKIKEQQWYQKFYKNCQNYIKLILPLDRIIIKIFLWCEIDPSNDWFHDRYILTEKGGVRFEGLDEGENPGQRTNVFRLSEELWKDRWNSLDKENSIEYKLLDTIDVPDLTSL